MDFKSSMTRRNFLQAMGLSAVLVGFGGSLHFLEQDKCFLRPPGALDEEAFLSRCIKCQKCVEVCPTNVIVPITLSEGIMAVSTPTMNFSQGYCDLCMKCTEVCPTSAIHSIKKEEVKIGIAKINPNVCIAWDWGGCTECIDACPLNAITLNKNQHPVVNENMCNGCGICENICPSGSLRAYNTQAKGKGIMIFPLQCS